MKCNFLRALGMVPALSLLLASAAWAQMGGYPNPYGYGAPPFGPPAGPGGEFAAPIVTPNQPMPAAFPAGWASMPVPAPQMMPAAYYNAQAAGYMMMPQQHHGGCPACGGAGCNYCMGGGHGGCPACGGAGCPHCCGPWTQHGPDCDGGCCAPRWFDFHVEVMYIERERASRGVDFTTEGIDGDVVLSSRDLRFEHEFGFRGTLAWVTGPGSNVEVSYFGTFDWNDTAEVLDPDNNLFSVFSEFGLEPFLGFQETDEAFRHFISYSAKLDSIEVNLRHRYVSPHCRFHGSYLAGFRYVRLDEAFRHETETAVPSNMVYRVATTNDLVGFQLGGDAYYCVFPGFMLGADFKAGVYGNSAEQDTVIDATTFIDPVIESVNRGDVAFVGEANALAIWRVNSRLTIRAGYQALFLDGVVLAIENFNATPPAVFNPPPMDNRVVGMNDNGSAFYHGGTAGFEWTW
jgi:hypothetical protein